MNKPNSYKLVVLLLSLAFGLVVTYASFGRPVLAKTLPWTRANTVSAGPAQSIGGYAWGCLQGGSELPSTGKGFQSIRRHRRRYFAHPLTIKTVIKLGKAALEQGLLPLDIGDLSQPRGGRMKYGHRSHQSGLDIDVWFGGDQGYLDQEGKKRLSRLKRQAQKKKWSSKTIKKKRFDIEHPSMIKGWREKLDTKVWSSRQQTLLTLAAKLPEVARIFIHFRIKEKMCDLHRASPEFKQNPEPLWLRKLRPWYGHHQHFHIRLHCPEDSPNCDPQGPLPKGLGCDGLEWFSKVQQKQRKKEQKQTEVEEESRRAKLKPLELKRLKQEERKKKRAAKKAKNDRLAKLMARCAHLGPLQ